MAFGEFVMIIARIGAKAAAMVYNVRAIRIEGSVTPISIGMFTQRTGTNPMAA